MDLFGKQNAGNLRGRTWKLEEFQEYFKGQLQEGGSEKFQAVAKALEEFSDLQDTPITQESAMKMVSASEKLRKACEEYSQSRRNAKSASGRERLAVVDCLAMYRDDLNLDQARDMKVVREHEGKTWKEAGRFEMAEITLETKDVQIVGDQVNQRMKVDHEGKKGFFTSELFLRSKQGYMDEIIDGIDPKEKDLKAVVTKYQKAFSDTLEELGGADRYEVQCACSVGEHWNELEEKAPGRKELARILSANGGMNKAGRVVEAYYGILPPRKKIDDEEKKKLMDEAIEKVLKEEDPELRKALSDNKEFLMGVRPPEKRMTGSVREYRYFKMRAIQEKADLVANSGLLHSGKKEIQGLDSLIQDGSLINRFLRVPKMAYVANGVSRPYLAEDKLDIGMELTSRNIATSRMAELLGVGRIVARSEKMKVHSGNKVMTGCFMEFAKGVDPSSKNERERRIMDQVEVTINPGLIRDTTTMEAFDFLCGQYDRHDKNLFYQLSEPDENGKRNVIGLQGIDNDLSFGSTDKDWTKGSANVEAMVFIDEEMAEKIRALDRETLEYALGDLIPAHQIDVMMKRVEKFQNHMKDMITVKPDGWALDEYKVTDAVKDTDERGKRYINGLKAFKEGKNQFIKGADVREKHKNAHVASRFIDHKRERAEGPKVALSFEELKDKERRQALRRDREVLIGRGRELKQQPERQQVKQPERQAAAPRAGR